MAYDDTLRLTGTSGNPVETVTTSAAGTSVYVGANRLCHADLRIANTSSGTSPALTITIQGSTAATTGFAAIVAFPQQTTAMTGEPGTGPITVSFRTGSTPYIRIDKTVGGTSPSFSGVSVLLRPNGEPAVP